MKKKVNWKIAKIPYHRLIVRREIHLNTLKRTFNEPKQQFKHSSIKGKLFKINSKKLFPLTVKNFNQPPLLKCLRTMKETTYGTTIHFHCLSYCVGR